MSLPFVLMRWTGHAFEPLPRDRSACLAQYEVGKEYPMCAEEWRQPDNLLVGIEALEEIWVQCPRFPAYSVSSHARVRRNTRRVLKQRTRKDGYVVVTLSVSGRTRPTKVHRLVAEAFLPPPEPWQNCACHRDDDLSNNLPSNLFWGSNMDNVLDKTSKGRAAIGGRHPLSKLTSKDIPIIRERAASGDSWRQIAADFGVSSPVIGSVIHRKTWKHVP